MRALVAALAMLVCGCAPEANTRYASTQVMLRIDASEELRASAQSLRARLWVKEPSRWRRGAELSIALEGRRWPFDVPVLPRFPTDENSQFEVILEAVREGEVIARDRVVTSFERDKLLVVRVTIARCASELRCDGDDCHGADCRECRGATCAPVMSRAADEVPTIDPAEDGGAQTSDAGAGRSDQDGAIGRGPDVDAQARDASGATLDASDPSPRGADAGANAVDSGSSAADAAASCPAQHGCPAGYPCVPTRAGYTCRGLRADWPMPDGVAGAKFAQRYSAKGGETVLDEVTKLEWQIGIPRVYPGCSGRTMAPNGTLGEYGAFCTREEGRAYCDKLERGGHDDWRMPTMIELVSLFDMREDTDWANAIDGDFFGDSDGLSFIADSASASGPTNGWMVAYNYRTIYVDRNLTGKVRCVRAGAEPSFSKPSERYEVTDATVTDKATTLVWQRSFSPNRLAPAAAEQYCTALGGGFRLPTPNELYTLVDPTREMPAIDGNAFPNTPSTEFATTPKIVAERHVEFGTGEFLVPGPDDAYVRCVR